MTNVALRKGARVANLPLAPVMAFIDTSDTVIGVEIAQIDARYLKPGQAVEMTFKFVPERSIAGRLKVFCRPSPLDRCKHQVWPSCRSKSSPRRSLSA